MFDMLRQPWHYLVVTTVLIGFSLSNPLLYLESRGNATLFELLTLRGVKTFDPYSITKLAAIGDSYSAGIGAGNRLGNIGQALSKQSGKSTIFETIK
jgi:hypothetical protein